MGIKIEGYGTSVRVVSPTVNEGLQVFSILHLRFILLLQVFVPLGFCGVELREISGNKWSEGTFCTKK